MSDTQLFRIQALESEVATLKESVAEIHKNTSDIVLWTNQAKIGTQVFTLFMVWLGKILLAIMILWASFIAWKTGRAPSFNLGE